MATKFETKSAITRLVQEISPRRLRLTGFSGSGYKLCNQILQRLTVVAMATKFETKQAITPLV